MKWLKNNLHLIVGAFLMIIFGTVFVNACIEGYYTVLTQEMIDDSYRIHR